MTEAELKSIRALAANQRRVVFDAAYNLNTEYAIGYAQRSMEELSGALCEIFGRDKTASSIYELADRITTKLPLEHWPQPKKAESASEPMASGGVPKTVTLPLRHAWANLLTGAWVGLVIGFVMWGSK